jgi:hypothetical protein
MVQVRVSGLAAPDSDIALREEIIAGRPFLEPIVAQHGHECIAVFRVREMVPRYGPWPGISNPRNMSPYRRRPHCTAGNNYHTPHLSLDRGRRISL